MTCSHYKRLIAINPKFLLIRALIKWAKLSKYILLWQQRQRGKKKRIHYNLIWIGHYPSSAFIHKWIGRYKYDEEADPNHPTGLRQWSSSWIYSPFFSGFGDAIMVSPLPGSGKKCPWPFGNPSLAQSSRSSSVKPSVFRAIRSAQICKKYRQENC